MNTRQDLPILPFDSRTSWEAWLEEHHETSSGLWLQIAKKGSGIETISYAEALDAALCHGWIDGQKGTFDEKTGCNGSRREDRGASGRRSTGRRPRS